MQLEDVEQSVDATHDCELIWREGAAPLCTEQPMGEEAVIADILVRSFETPAGYRLAYDDTGTFDISRDGSQIVWWGGERQPDDGVQTDILGRVIAFVLHARGVLTLHASAVSVDGAGLAFLAPKFYGKSTLAYALLGSGARLVGDDAVAIELGLQPRLLPGVQKLRLFGDSAKRGPEAIEADGGRKLRIRPNATRVMGASPTLLSAIYVLSPEQELGERGVAWRERLSGPAAALPVITYRKLGALLDGKSSGLTFESAVQLARMVPVYRLGLVRDLRRLDDVAQAVIAWHDTTTRSGFPAGRSAVGSP